MAQEKDPINPSYYTTYQVGLSCKHIVRHMGFDAGTAFAYVWRAGKKDDLKLDLDKATWYIQDLVNNEPFLKDQVTDAAWVLFNLLENVHDSPRFDCLRAIMNCDWESALDILEGWKVAPVDFNAVCCSWKTKKEFP